MHAVPDAPEREMPVRESDAVDMRPAHPYKEEPRTRRLPFDEEYDLAHFIEGPGNRLVCRVIRDYAEGRADAYARQLLIYGPPGSGKSHALFCIGRSIAQANQDVHIVYVRAQDFVQEYVDAAWGERDVKELFRRKYQAADVLLVDDAHAFSGEKSQMRFISILEALYARKGIVAIGAEKPPHEFSKAVLPALRSRFLAMLILPITAHHEETAVRIFMKKVELFRMDISEEWARAIVRKVGSDSRVLAGVLKRLKIEPELIAGEVDMARLEGVVPFESQLTPDMRGKEPVRRRKPSHLRMVMGGTSSLDFDA
jgi:chromosomal replication initiation ATPase DnaA